MDFNQWLQSRLTAHGYACGVIDGVLGATTMAALKAFQAGLGLEPSGKADAATVAALRVSSGLMTPAGVPDRAIIDDGKVKPSHSAWPRQTDCLKFYGPVGTSQVSVDIPFDMYLAWDKGTRIRRMSLHAKVAASAAIVFNRIAGVYSAAERKALGLDLFGGSLNVRKMRGGSSYSMHSWGIAIDFDPERNQLAWGRDRARLAQADALPFWNAWEAEGWISLGRQKNFDWMHVQAARL
ncbi:peptidoglycan-binding protein [Shinella sp.]|jgi:hypothetical protein|uniref:peptidoglycan-binding protein n=1 Tax=Shinella sp. TaxID=1870904 RepID=UPI003F72D3F4